MPPSLTASVFPGIPCFCPRLQDIKGQVYPFCRDQHGSRLVQQQLEAADAATLAGAPCCAVMGWRLSGSATSVGAGAGALWLRCCRSPPCLPPTCLILSAV